MMKKKGIKITDPPDKSADDPRNEGVKFGSHTVVRTHGAVFR